MTPRRSARAAAQRVYWERVDAGAAHSNSAPPTPDPSPPLAVLAGGGERDLMAQVRALYEDSAVPVREIARCAGVSERTLYKYACKNNWTPRYAWMPDGSRPSGWPARRRWTQARERAVQFAPEKGAGGRFVRREEKGKPFAQGIKALDPAGRAAAAKASAEAARAAERAELQVECDDVVDVQMRALQQVNRTMGLLIRHREQWKGCRPTDFSRECEGNFVALWRAAVEWYEYTVGWGKQLRERLRRFDADNAAAPVTSACSAPS